MLGRALSILSVVTIFANSAFAANVISLPFKPNDEAYTWNEVECHMRGADIEIASKSAEGKGGKGSIHFTLRNFRTVMNNTVEGKDAIFEMDDKTVGDVRFVERNGVSWGDMKVSDLRSSCKLRIRRGERKNISLTGSCEQLGDLVKKSGPRTSLVVEAMACTVQP